MRGGRQAPTRELRAEGREAGGGEARGERRGRRAPVAGGGDARGAAGRGAGLNRLNCERAIAGWAESDCGVGGERLRGVGASGSVPNQPPELWDLVG